MANLPQTAAVCKYYHHCLNPGFPCCNLNFVNFVNSRIWLNAKLKCIIRLINWKQMVTIGFLNRCCNPNGTAFKQGCVLQVLLGEVWIYQPIGLFCEVAGHMA